MNHEMYLLTVDVPPKIEDSVVDFLLALDWRQGFSSFSANVHDPDTENLSLLEQVTGFQRRIRFQIYVEKSHLFTLLTKLKVDFAGSGLRFWVLPALEHGKI